MKELKEKISILESKISDPKTPQGEIRSLSIDLHSTRQKLNILEQESFERLNKLSVYGSDDYVGCSAGDYSFYFGYEITKCSVKSHKDEDDCYENSCDKREWCFQADKDGKTIVTWAESEFSYNQADDIERKLILGICKFIKDILTPPTNP